MDLNESLQYSCARGGSIQHGVSKAICYAVAASSSHVIKLPICSPCISRNGPYIRGHPVFKHTLKIDLSIICIFHEKKN